MFCQRCGKRNQTDQEKCKFCGAPLLMVAPDRLQEGAGMQPFLSVEDYLLDKLSALEKDSHRSSDELDLLVHAMDFLERNAMVNRAGIHVLVAMLCEKGLIEPREFDRRWRERTLDNLSDLYRKERFLDARPDFLASFRGKSRRRFDELVSRAEDLLYGLQSRAAAEVLDQALALDPDNAPLLAYLGELRLGMGDLKEAQVHLGKALAQKQPGMAAVIAFARLMLRSGRPAEAEKRLEQAIQREPEDVDAWTLLALAKAMAGHWRGCQGCAEKAVAIEERPAGVFLLAHAFVRQGKLAAAEKHLDQLIAAYPEWEEALTQRGLLYLARGWWSRAAEVFERLRDLNPSADTAGLVRRFRSADRARQREMVALPLDAERVLERMDPAAEEAGMYLRQMESEE